VIQIIKRVPVASGIAGGSANAAATIRLVTLPGPDRFCMR
jgi:4-diphosphocytidyl-2C-methyl-D-erythritol kinase